MLMARQTDQAFIPDIAFAAVPNIPRRSSSSSTDILKKAIISATKASLHIAYPPELQRNPEQNKPEHDEDPRYSTIKDIAYNNNGSTSVKKSATLESVVFKPVLTSTKKKLPKYETTCELFDENDNVDGAANKNEKAKFVSPDILRLYAIPLKKPIAVKHSKRNHQITSLQTLKLMLFKTIPTENDRRKDFTIIKQQVEPTEKIQDEIQRTNATSSPVENIDFLYEMQVKLENLNIYLWKYLEEEKVMQNRAEEQEKGKLIWEEKMKEAREIFQDNLLLKNNLLKMEADRKRQVRATENEMIALKNVNCELTAKNRELQEQCDSLQKLNHQLLEDKEQTIPMEHHNAVVMEIQQLLETLKQKYREESNHLCTQITNGTYEREQLKVELVKIQHEAEEMQIENQVLSKAFEECHKKCINLMTHLETTHQLGVEAQALLEAVLSEVQQANKEKLFLLQKNEELDEKQLQMLLAIAERRTSFHHLQEKFADLKEELMNNFEEINFRMCMKKSESKYLREKHFYNIHCLKEIIAEKDKNLEEANYEKRCLQLDLKNLWKLTMND